MSQTVAELLDAALALSEPERAELAELLAASLPTPSSALHPAWVAELRRRAAIAWYLRRIRTCYPSWSLCGQHRGSN